MGMQEDNPLVGAAHRVLGGMMAASRCVSAGLILALTPAVAAITGQAVCGCQTVPARSFPCPRVPEGVKRQHALWELWL